MKKRVTKSLSMLLSFALAGGMLPLNAYAAIKPVEQVYNIDAHVAETEDKIGKVEGNDIQFIPSDELISYASRKIDVANPTEILDYSDKTENNLPNAAEATEYFIKAVSEGQAGIVLYGDKEFAGRTIESVVYSTSYGIYLRHLKNWRIETQLIDSTNDVYRHLVSFQYNLPKSHTIELEERIDTIANWILSEYKNVNIPEEMKTLNHLDEKGVEDLQKAMLIHDYVIKNVKPYYGNATFYGKNKSERHSLNSAMFEGETVCQGFFLLFSRLADRVGLETRAVRGYKGFVGVENNNDESKQQYIQQMESAVRYAKRGGRWGMDEGSFGANHGWNQVKIGNHWYHADMSSDSSYTNQKLGAKWIQPEKLYYRYFLKTDQEFKEPLSVKALAEDGRIIDSKVFLVWQGNENYDTPAEPFVWTYDIMYAYDLNKGINSNPYLQSKFTKNYPMGNAWNEKGKFEFAEKDLTHVPETRYEMTIPGYEAGAEPIKIKKGISTPEEALKFVAASGIEFKDGSRAQEGYVDYSTLKLIEVKHDDAAEKEAFDQVKNMVGERITLTAYFDANGQRYSEEVELIIADDSEFKSTTDLRLKEGAQDIVTVPQHLHINNNHLENQRLRAEKIAEIDREILSRVEVVKDGNIVPIGEYSGEKKLSWKDSKVNNDNAPISEPTKDENGLIRLISVKGDDNRWTSLEFKIHLTEVEKQTTTIVECDTYYIEKTASDKVGLIMPRTGRDIADGGDLEKFFRYRGYPITMKWTNSSGLVSQRLNVEIYVLDDDGNPQYRTQRYYNGILMGKDAKGGYTVKTKNTLNQMFSTPGLYKFNMIAWNDEDRIKVVREFTVKVYSDDEWPIPNKYTVTFHANGHGKAPEAVEIEEGKAVSRPDALTEEGWTFGGWYEEADCINSYDFGKTITGNITLFAKWTANKEGEDASTDGKGTDDKEASTDGKSTDDKEASTDGKSTDDKETSTGDGSSGNRHIPDEGDILDENIATPSNCIVTFDNNGHGAAPASQKLEKGQKAIKPSDPDEKNYIFGGWYEEAECINAYDFARPIVENITLFAKWTLSSSATDPASEGSGEPSEDSRKAGESVIQDALSEENSERVENSRKSGESVEKDTSSERSRMPVDVVQGAVESDKRDSLSGIRSFGGVSSGSRSYSSGNSGRSGAGRGKIVVSRKNAGTEAEKENSKESEGSWRLDEKGWWYQDANGNYPKNEWKQLNNSNGAAWYAFDEFGYIRTDWFFNGGHWYYLSAANDANLGKLVTGWVEIDGKWYYLEPTGNADHPQGAMYMNEKTPDGYTVDANGAWVK